MLRKIIYITGTRADYGLMREILKKLDASDDFTLSICVTGMHLSSLYGNTVCEIENDNFIICGKIHVDVERTNHVSMSKSIGYGIIGMTEIFEHEKPDVILLLGDRGETLAAAIAAVHLNLPIVHIHGGERSGTVDEMVRHAISKLSHYHFVATDASRDRLIKMGENEENVIVIGAPGLDEICKFKPLSREVFYSNYGLSFDKKIALLIYHPVVQEIDDINLQFHNAIKAALSSKLQVLCFEPNSDAGGHLIREALYEYDHNEDVKVFKHLSRNQFIDLLANVDVMVGNSSSGIIESASFNLVTVNIGTRQNLRDYGENVIHVATDYLSVLHGLQCALQREKKIYTNIYGDGKTADRCYQLLKTINLGNKILNKCNVY